MQIRKFIIFAAMCVTASTVFAQGSLFDLDAIRDTETLDVTVLHDWQPAPREPSVMQKLVEVTVCQWWPGQKIRLPVTLSAPKTAISGDSCKHLLVANQSLPTKTARLSAAQLELIKQDGVGVVLIGIGTIDTMQPVGKLHHEMRRRLLKTKDPRFCPAWIWGISHMRALTTALTEPTVFAPEKVLATGGSKRGVATAAAGVYDDRFTAIMPVVAPPLGNPGGAFVLGTEDESITQANEKFFADLAAGKLDLPESTKKSLQGRAQRRRDVRVTLQQTREAGWSADDIATISDQVWDASRVTDYLPKLRQRGLDIFYNVGTNDSVSPALLELGKRFPDFPICIIPGGQHGGPSDAGFTRRVPQNREVQENFLSFARIHFQNARKMIAAPMISSQWDAEQRKLTVSVEFPDKTKPQKNELWWNLDRSEPYTLPFEYDQWTAVQLSLNSKGIYQTELTFARTPARIDFVSLHTDNSNDTPLTISSPYQRLDPR